MCALFNDTRGSAGVDLVSLYKHVSSYIFFDIFLSTPIYVHMCVCFYGSADGFVAGCHLPFQYIRDGKSFYLGSRSSRFYLFSLSRFRGQKVGIRWLLLTLYVLGGWIDNVIGWSRCCFLCNQSLFTLF